jgi:hypothetical protein
MLQHELHSQYFAENVIRMKTLRMLKLVGLAVRVGEKTNSYKISTTTAINGRDRFRGLGVQQRWQDNIKEDFNKREFDGVD